MKGSALRSLALKGILVALAIIISYVERMFPLDLFIPLPGVKLGLANIITIFALFYLDIKSATIIILLRCIVTSLMFGSIISFLFSFSGGILALLVMALLKHGYDKTFSIIGISIGGAAAHNIAQIIIASILLGSVDVFTYLTILLTASLITGILTGVASGSVLEHMHKIKLLKI